MNTLKHWLRLATTSERNDLAKLANTTRGGLYFISNSHMPYGRNASPELASRIEQAAEEIRNRSEEAKKRLPTMLRVDLAPLCRECPFAQRCLGDRVIAAEFEYLPDEKPAAEKQ